MPYRYIAAALLVVGSLIWWWLEATAGALPGFTATREHLDLLWITFWATLFASLIVALVAGVALYFWQDAFSRRRMLEEVSREVAVLKEDLLFELDQIGIPTGLGPKAMVSPELHGAAAVLRGKPLQHWHHILPHDTFWTFLSTFRKNYAEFLTVGNMYEKTLRLLIEEQYTGTLPDGDEAVVVGAWYCIKAIGRPENKSSLFPGKRPELEQALYDMAESFSSDPGVASMSQRFYHQLEVLEGSADALRSNLAEAVSDQLEVE